MPSFTNKRKLLIILVAYFVFCGQALAFPPADNDESENKTQFVEQELPINDPATPEKEDARVRITHFPASGDAEADRAAYELYLRQTLAEAPADSHVAKSTLDYHSTDAGPHNGTEIVSSEYSTAGEVIASDLQTDLQRSIDYSKKNIIRTITRVTFISGAVVFSLTTFIDVPFARAAYSTIFPSLLSAYLMVTHRGYRTWFTSKVISPVIGRLPLKGLKHLPLPFIMDPNVDINSYEKSGWVLSSLKMYGFLGIYLSFTHVADQFYARFTDFAANSHLAELSQWYTTGDLKSIAIKSLIAFSSEALSIKLNGDITEGAIEKAKMELLTNIERQTLEAKSAGWRTVEAKLKTEVGRLENRSANWGLTASVFLTTFQILSVISKDVYFTTGFIEWNSGTISLGVVSTAIGIAYIFKDATIKTNNVVEGAIAKLAKSYVAQAIKEKTGKMRSHLIMGCRSIFGSRSL